jgi:hypothetical protein
MPRAQRTTQRISNALTLTGQAGNLLTLGPLTAATKWFLHVASNLVTQTISYVSVSYGDASPGETTGSAATNTIRVYSGSTVLCSATTNNDATNSWTCNSSVLSEGTYTIHAIVRLWYAFPAARPVWSVAP